MFNIDSFYLRHVFKIALLVLFYETNFKNRQFYFVSILLCYIIIELCLFISTR